MLCDGESPPCPSPPNFRPEASSKIQNPIYDLRLTPQKSTEENGLHLKFEKIRTEGSKLIYNIYI